MDEPLFSYSQIVSLIVKSITDDVLIDSYEGLSYDNKERRKQKDNFRKNIENLIKNKSYDSYLFKQYSNKFYNNTSFPYSTFYFNFPESNFDKRLIQSFFKSLYNGLCINLHNFSWENNIKEKIKIELYYNFTKFLISNTYARSEDDIKKIATFIQSLFNKDFKIKDLFTSLKEEMNVSSIQELNNQIVKNELDNRTKTDNDIIQSIDRYTSVIKRCSKDNTVPEYLDLLAIIKVSKDELLQSSFLLYYFIYHTSCALKKVFNFSDEDINGLKDKIVNSLDAIIEKKKIIVEEMNKIAALATPLQSDQDFEKLYKKKLNSTKNPFIHNYMCDFLKVSDVESSHDIKSFVDKASKIKNSKKSIDEKIKQLELEKEKIQQKGNVSKAFSFFLNWKKGELYESINSIEIATTYFDEATKNMNYGGEYVSDFLEHLIEFYIFHNGNLAKARYDDNKSPLPIKAKKLWQYGYAIGVINDDEYSCYKKTILKKIRTEVKNNIIESKLQSNTEYDYIDYYIKHDDELDVYYNLLKDTTINTINKNLLYPAFNIELSRFSLMLIYAAFEERFIELSNKWICNPATNITLRNYDSSTPLTIASYQYKMLIKSDSSITYKYKKLYLNLLQHCSREKQDLKRSGTSFFNNILLDAIDIQDIELIKEIIYKYNNNIDSIRNNMNSHPLIYTLCLLMDSYLFQNISDNTGNTNFFDIIANRFSKLTKTKVEDIKNEAYEYLNQNNEFLNSLSAATNTKKRKAILSLLKQDFGEYTKDLKNIIPLEKAKEVFLIILENTKSLIDEDEAHSTDRNNLGEYLYTFILLNDMDTVKALLKALLKGHIIKTSNHEKIEKEILIYTITILLLDKHFDKLDSFIQLIKETYNYDLTPCITEIITYKEFKELQEDDKKKFYEVLDKWDVKHP